MSATDPNSGTEPTQREKRLSERAKRVAAWRAAAVKSPAVAAEVNAFYKKKNALRNERRKRAAQKKVQQEARWKEQTADWQKKAELASVEAAQCQDVLEVKCAAAADVAFPKDLKDARRARQAGRPATCVQQGNLAPSTSVATSSDATGELPLRFYICYPNNAGSRHVTTAMRNSVRESPQQGTIALDNKRSCAPNLATHADEQVRVTGDEHVVPHMYGDGFIADRFCVKTVGFVPKHACGILALESDGRPVAGACLTFHPVTEIRGGGFFLEYLEKPPTALSGKFFNTAVVFNGQHPLPEDVVGFIVNVQTWSSGALTVTFAPDRRFFKSEPL